MNKTLYIFIFLFFNILQIKTAKVNLIDENSSEAKYKDEFYLNSYRIPSRMMLYKSNGKSLNPYPLRNAFDGNFSSYWQSFYLQDDSFKINIEITFSKTVSIDRILYQAPTFNKTQGDGYPIELKVYYKLKNSDGTYNKNISSYLLIDDIISERTGDKVVFTLDQVVECDQIKLEWNKVEKSDNSEYSYAFASEIMFLFPENEYLNKLLFEVFDEKDKNKINSEYNDLSAIQKIEENLQDYIDSYTYIGELIEKAKKIIAGEKKDEKS